ncbi:hypothetical protein Poli38472_012578 [Pythium oligandrum]|uniref:Uncharacterized protein n=1 Tax=Pythium oligandrum TaxID=41045 RepID=A0A8K1CDQ1_PYTOL|nr:hypothetical protein Poli38472_012578 [Pythium oligandrum]|eukprot:TMW61387.1 hypothetical protein Poli38472_012578 [Pythium oligandrum]
MKPRLPSLAMPTLKLTDEEQQAVIDESEAVLAEFLVHEPRIRTGMTKLDKKKWKEVKAQEDFRVYKERRPSLSMRDQIGVLSDVLTPRFISLRDAPILSAWTMKESSDEEPSVITTTNDPNVPIVVATGHVEGLLEDVSLAH